jgi:alpha-L-fucosidase
MTRRQFLGKGLVSAAALATSPLWLPRGATAATAPSGGPFQPTWDSLSAYAIPDWFRDAKFGIWAHWGPQCVPEMGDWYGRLMYQQGHPDYEYQVAHYGHPSKAGFKDVIHTWNADRWDPEHLIDLYQRAGARYFMSMANHHDNFDNFDSTHQPWNSGALGPRKDIVGTWEKIARRAGLRFAVSVHASHAWSWYEVAQGSDRDGPLAGVPYDGRLTRADGKGLWWDGLDPQDLYSQNHKPGRGLAWEWEADQGSSIPDAPYIEKFYNRTIELIDRYDPDLVYFDDTVMPLYPISDVGLRIASHYYNQNIRRRGRLEAVMTGKWLSEQQRKCLVDDRERGNTDRIDPLHWQTDTCIGQWHYQRSLFENHAYMKPEQAVHLLIDIVSKNGNLMLNIPLPGYGEPDADELAFLADFTRWMDLNKSAIYDTRPWRVYGEGPVADAAAAGYRDRPPYAAADFRFLQKNGDVYAFAMAWPDTGALTIASLGSGASTGQGYVGRVELLGVDAPLSYIRTGSGLQITLPTQRPCDHAYALKISGGGLAA